MRNPPALSNTVAGATLALSGRAPTVDSVAHVALLLALMLLAARFGGEVATRLKQPPVLGELLAGMLLGNLPFSPLRGLGSDASLEILSQLGVLMLLFGVGLESTLREVLTVGAAAARVAVLGIAGSFLAGFSLVELFAPTATTALCLFLSAAISATSIGITARVFRDLGRARSREAHTILGAAVLDDIIGLLILSFLSAWFTRPAGTAVSFASLTWILAKTVSFLLVAVVAGVKVTPRVFALAAGLRTGGALITVGLVFCFLLSWAADAMGLAPLVGAFAAGLVLEDAHSAKFVARGEPSLSGVLEPISNFLVPIFFVVMGIRADLASLFQSHVLRIALVLTVAAIAGKLLAGLGSARGTSRLTVAFGMLPRGEVSLIFASLGLSFVYKGAPLLGRELYSALVAVVIVTTLLTPALLRWSVNRSP